APTLSDLPGPLVNVVTVSGTPSVGTLVQATASASVALQRPNVGMRVQKHASAPQANVGDPIRYDYEITNVGTMTLTVVAARDDKLGDRALGTAVLNPGEMVTTTKSYTTAASDLPGPLVNIITATATPLVGDALVVTDSASVRLLEGGLIFTKSIGIEG